MHKCEFPNCEYETKYRTQIHRHHIKPVECGGSDKNFNLIYLCPNHHTKIYIPEATHGIHTVNGDDSIILKRWFKSTVGKTLEYEDENGDIQYY